MQYLLMWAGGLAKCKAKGSENYWIELDVKAAVIKSRSVQTRRDLWQFAQTWFCRCSFNSKLLSGIFLALFVSTLCICSRKRQMQLRWPQNSLCISFMWVRLLGSALESFWGIQQFPVFVTVFKKNLDLDAIPCLFTNFHASPLQLKLPRVASSTAVYFTKRYRTLRPVFPVWASDSQLSHNVISFSTSSLKAQFISSDSIC